MRTPAVLLALMGATLLASLHLADRGSSSGPGIGSEGTLRPATGDPALLEALARVRAGREEFLRRDAATTFQRRAVLHPARAGNAWETYSGLENSYSASRQRPDAQDLEEILLAAHQDVGLTPQPREEGNFGAGSWEPLIVADCLVGNAVDALDDPTESVRWSTAALLVAWEGRAFGSIEPFRFTSEPVSARYERTMRHAIAAIRRALSAGQVAPAVLADLARLLDAIAARPQATRRYEWEFVYAASIVAGAWTGEMDRTPVTVKLSDTAPLDTEAALRNEAVRLVLDEGRRVTEVLDGPPRDMVREIPSMRDRWAAPANPYLWMNVHEGTWFGACSASDLDIVGKAPVLSPHAMLESVRDWLRSIAYARALVAAERHRIDKARVPTSLVDLVPTYLSSAPSDPTTGLPLGYAAGNLWLIPEDPGLRDMVPADGGIPDDVGRAPPRVYVR